MACCLPEERRSSATKTTTGAEDATRTLHAMIALRINCPKRFFFLPLHRLTAAISFAFAPATRDGGGWGGVGGLGFLVQNYGTGQSTVLLKTSLALGRAPLACDD